MRRSFADERQRRGKRCSHAVCEIYAKEPCEYILIREKWTA